MAKTRCPNCGVLHEIDEPKKGTFENRVRRPFKTDAMAPTFPAGQPEINQQAPTGLPGWDSHVKIPLRQAVIFGLFDAPVGVGVGLVGGIGLAMLFNAASRDNLTSWGYVIIIGTGGAIGGLVALCQEAKRRWPERLEIYDALLWVEEITGMDIDGDGEVGEPEPEVLRIELQDQSGRPRLIADLETDRERFEEFARWAVTLNLGFSEEVARKAGYKRKEWERIRDTFIELKGARWKDESNHKLGLYLLENGYKLFGKVLPTPLPAGDVSKNTLGTVERMKTNHIQGVK